MKFRKLAQVFATRLGIRALSASFEDSNAIPMKSSEDVQAAYEGWVNALPPGVFEKPVEQWDETLLGQRIGWHANIVMSSFSSSLGASVRAAACLYHRMEDAGQTLWVVGGGCHGAKKEVEREEFSLVIRRVGPDGGSSVADLSKSGALKLEAAVGPEMVASLNDRSNGMSASAIVGPEAGSTEPREKLCPVWDDPRFCVDIAKQFLAAPGPQKGNWTAAMENTAFALAIFEHASLSNSETLHQKGTLVQEGPQGKPGIVYAMELQRSEVPSPLVQRTVRRSGRALA